MLKIVYRYLLMTVAMISIVVGILGVFLPILPGTPFFILALACFDRSSPTFHKKLLHLPYIGKPLQDWDKEKKITRKRKLQIYLIVLTTFSISLFSIANLALKNVPLLQLLLVVIMLLLLFFISRIDEK